MSPFESLPTLIQFIFDAHQRHSTEPRKAFRRWDGKTPYAVHPTWCAMTILTEATLPEELRVAGAQALLLHDILEDTTAPLPADTPGLVRGLVNEMTFASTEDEMQTVWSRSMFCRLLKLYDKTSNLLDSTGLNPEKLVKYREYTLKLADDVEKTYGPSLNILKLARAICKP